MLVSIDDFDALMAALTTHIVIYGSSKTMRSVRLIIFILAHVVVKIMCALYNKPFIS